MEHGFTGPSSATPRGVGFLGAGLAIAALTLGACQAPDTGGAPTRFDEPIAEGEHGGHDGPGPLPSVAPRPSGPSVAALLEKAKEHFAPLPEAADNPRNPITEEKVTLGRMLYFDKRLSKAGDIACATCHVLDQYGIDPREADGKRMATSLGHQGQEGDRNSPSVYNAGLFIRQFWDGRAADLEEQAKGPILNPVEMAMPDEATVVTTLQGIPGYVEAFRAAFPGQEDPVTYDNMAKAIGAFERQLMTPAPFDDFLEGKLTALDEQQLSGLQLFIDADCKQCHYGAAVGGLDMKTVGVVKPWEGIDPETKFKVPSLRNITKTGPYLHDGSIDSLEDMVQKMSIHQVAKGELPPDELSAMVAFLGSLEGRLPSEYIAEPELPADGPAPTQIRPPAPAADDGEPDPA